MSTAALVTVSKERLKPFIREMDAEKYSSEIKKQTAEMPKTRMSAQ